MSFDDRLRAGFDEQAVAFEPEVERALDSVRSRGRAHRWRGRSIVLAASVATAASLVGVTLMMNGERPRDLQPLDDQTAVPAREPTGDAAPPLRGTLVADIAEPSWLAGTWTMSLQGNGTMEMSPPRGYGGNPTGLVFTADASSFRTALFSGGACADDGTGVYGWVRREEQIVFDTVSDTCRARITFLTGSSWALSTEVPPRQ